MVACQLDELHASLIVVNFQGGHARVLRLRVEVDGLWCDATDAAARGRPGRISAASPGR